MHHLDTDQNLKNPASNDIMGLGLIGKFDRGSGKTGDELLEKLRKDRTDRVITFRVDSGACTTAVPRSHHAA